MEQQDIPRISFQTAGKAKLGIDLLKLSGLFSRNDSLNHALDEAHRLAFYVIIFITKGAGIHHVDFRPYSYEKGSLLFMAKGQVQAFEVRADVDGFIILFTEDFLVKNLIDTDALPFHRLYNYHLHEPIVQVDTRAETIVGTTINEMYEEFQGADDFAQEDILRLQLKLLLLNVERGSQGTTVQHIDQKWMALFGKFRNLLEENLHETRNANDYAQMMDVSYKHLNETCKAVVGKTAKGFIDDYLILESKRYLAVSDIPIKELTYKLGFDEPTNFVKFFKKHTGSSPSQFRKTTTPKNS